MASLMETDRQDNTQFETSKCNKLFMRTIGFIFPHSKPKGLCICWDFSIRELFSPIYLHCLPVFFFNFAAVLPHKMLVWQLSKIHPQSLAKDYFWQQSDQLLEHSSLIRESLLCLKDALQKHLQISLLYDQQDAAIDIVLSQIVEFNFELCTKISLKKALPTVFWFPQLSQALDFKVRWWKSSSLSTLSGLALLDWKNATTLSNFVTTGSANVRYNLVSYILRRSLALYLRSHFLTIVLNSGRDISLQSFPVLVDPCNYFSSGKPAQAAELFKWRV